MGFGPRASFFSEPPVGETVYITLCLPGMGRGYEPSASGMTGAGSLRDLISGAMARSDLMASAHSILSPEYPAMRPMMAVMVLRAPRSASL